MDTLSIDRTCLYPLRLEPIYQYRLWGGRRLADLLNAPLPGDGLVGEAWILSDRDDHASRIANGSLKGKTIHDVMDEFREPMMGPLADRFQRFPLLLKFLDAHQMLSVQVHPGYAHRLLPDNETAKTEAWVVLEADKQSCIYAGLIPGTTEDILRNSLTNGTVAEHLTHIVPKPGDAVFVPAGTVHSLGGDVIVFEVQQNSDVTFRLYDWNHVDAATGKPRELQVDQALASIDFADDTAGLVRPTLDEEGPGKREKLFDCEAFLVWRISGHSPFRVGAAGVPRVLVCLEGSGAMEHGGSDYTVSKGEVWILPAAVGMCTFRPVRAVNLLEIAIPT